MRNDPKWIELQRLLYCMEAQPDVVEGQSWQSLLLRAQLAQDVWHDIAANCSQEEYDRLAYRVDQACRYAQELADRHQQQQNDGEEDNAFEISNSNDEGANNDTTKPADDGNNVRQDIDAVIENLFFSQESTTHKDVGLEETTSEEDYYEEFEDDENEDAEEEGDPTAQQQQNHQADSQPASSLEDLQQAQREQMEEAISMMARQMKEATQGIHATLQQQTKSTLNELETVAEQNVQDVTQVSQNIQQHNTNRQRSNFGTWTMLFMIVGTFVGCLLTIFTIPKTPNSSGFGVLSKGMSIGMSTGRTLASTAWTQSIKLYGQIMHPEESLWDDGDEEEDDGDNEGADSAKANKDVLSDEEWKSLYDENDLERQQKEQLDKLLQEMNGQGKKKKLQDVAIPDWRDALNEEENGDDEGDDNPWGQKPVMKKAKEQDDEDDNPWGQKPVAKVKKMINNEEDNPWGQKPVEKKTQKKTKKKTMEKAEEEEEQGNPWGQKPVKFDQQEQQGDEDTNDDSSGKPSETAGEEEKDKQDGDNENTLEEQAVQTETATTKDDNEANEGGEADAVPMEDVTEEDAKNRLDSPDDAKVEDDGEDKGRDSEANDADEADAVPIADVTEEDVKNRSDSPEDTKVEDGDKEHEEAPKETLSAVQDEPGIKDPSEVNMDQLMESLKQHAQQKDAILAEQHRHAEQSAGSVHFDTASATAGSESASGSKSEGTAEDTLNEASRRDQTAKQSLKEEPEAFAREGIAKRRVTPRDLRIAAGSGDIEKVKESLDLHPEYVNRRDKNGWSPLHMAARNGQIDVLRVLLDFGSDLTLATNEGELAYQIAVNNHGRGYEAVDLLRPNGFCDDEDLRFAAGARNFDGVKECLEMHPEFVNMQDRNGWSPLHEAARNVDVAIIKILLEAGADKTLITNNSETPFQLAVDNHGREHEAVELVRPEGHVDEDDLRRALFDGDHDRVQEYLKLRSDFVNRQDNAGWTVLHEVARSGDTHMLQILLDHGGDRDLQTNGGETAYQIAVNFHGVEHDTTRTLRPGHMTVEEAARLEEERRKAEELQRMEEQARREKELEARRLERKKRREEAAKRKAAQKQQKEQQEPNVGDAGRDNKQRGEQEGGEGAMGGNQQQNEQRMSGDNQQQQQRTQDGERRPEDDAKNERQKRKEQLMAMHMQKAKEEKARQAEEEKQRNQKTEQAQHNEESVERKSERERAREAGREKLQRERERRLKQALEGKEKLRQSQNAASPEDREKQSMPTKEEVVHQQHEQGDESGRQHYETTRDEL